MEKEYVIYKATNNINGKIYVGKTYNLEKRKREHIYDIDNKLPFHRALKKYGIDKFTWEVIDNAVTNEEAMEKEVYWIKKLNTCIHSKNSNGYNITLGGEGGVSWNSRPIVQYTLEGDYVDEYISCSQASLITGIGRHNIGDCLNKKTKQSGNYQWFYKDEINYNVPKKFINTRGLDKKIPVIQLDLDGNYVNEYSSIKLASEKCGIRRTTISGCLSEKTRRAGGFQWIYKSKYDPNEDYKFSGIKYGNGIVQLDDNFNIINRFSNCVEAVKYLGEPYKVHKQIHSRLKADKRCRGYYWMRYDDYLKLIQQGNTEVIT